MDIKGLLSDPEFLALDEPTQRQVLSRLDPEFSKLSREQYQEFRLKVSPPTPQQSAQLAKNDRIIQGMEPLKDQGLLPTLWNDIKALPSRTMDFLSGHPMHDMYNASGEQADAAKEALRRNDYSSAIGHTLAGVLPVVGPSASQAGEELGGGQPGQGAAHTIEMLAPMVTHGVAELPWQNPIVRERVPVTSPASGFNPLNLVAPTKWKIGKAIYDALSGDANPTPNIRTKTSLRSPLNFSESPEFIPFGAKPLMPPVASDVQTRLHAIQPIDPSAVNITPSAALNTNTLPPRPPIWDMYPDTVRPPTPPEFVPFGSKPILPALPESTEVVKPVRAPRARGVKIDTNKLPKSPPLYDMFPETVKPPTQAAAQPATSPVQPQGPIQIPAPVTPIPPVVEDMQNPIMGYAEAHRYAHAQAQAAELPGSPAGTRAGGHEALTAIAKAKYGKNAWHELAPAQMQEIGDWLLDINMQRAQKAGQGIPPVK
jgi:hypothetical protein